MDYREEMTKAMTLLAEQSNTIFIGQSICYPGNVMFATLKNVPMEKRIELPVFEDTQMGISIGLSLAGYLPISIFARMDFLICAMNQLVNHLDKFEQMSNGRVHPKVIIRTSIGAKIPMDGGPQHTGDYRQALRRATRSIHIDCLETAEDIMMYYQYALDSKNSSILIERGDRYEVKREFKTRGERPGYR